MAPEETAMYEKDPLSTPASTSEYAPRTPASGDPVTPRTPPKYEGDSFSERSMKSWQVTALAMAALALVVLVVLFT